MEVQLTVRHSKAAPEIQQHIQEEVDKLEKYYQKITSCHVVLDTEHTQKVAEIVMNVQSHTLSATASDENIAKAVDSAVAKIERQLKKINEKIKKHHTPKN